MGTILKQAVKYESGKFPYLDCQCGHRLSVNMGCPTTVCICGLIYDDGGYILNHDTVCRGCVTDGKEAHTCPEHAITTETLLKVRERILANLHRVSAKLAERMPRLPIVAGRPGIFEAYCLTIRRAYPEPDLLVAVAREVYDILNAVQGDDRSLGILHKEHCNECGGDWNCYCSHGPHTEAMMCPQCKLASSEEDERQTKIAEDLGRAMREMGEEEPGW